MQARFSRPVSVAADARGNVYVFDAGSRALRRIDAAGNVATVVTLPPSQAFVGLNSSYGIAVDAAGNVYLADTAFNSVRKISAAGAVSTVIEPSQLQALGVAGFNYPNAVAIVGNDLFVTSGTAIVVLRNRP
jgi:streptogramin lyase